MCTTHPVLMKGFGDGEWGGVEQRRFVFGDQSPDARENLEKWMEAMIFYQEEAERTLFDFSISGGESGGTAEGEGEGGGEGSSKGSEDGVSGVQRMQNVCPHSIQHTPFNSVTCPHAVLCVDQWNSHPTHGSCFFRFVWSQFSASMLKVCASKCGYLVKMGEQAEVIVCVCLCLCVCVCVYVYLCLCVCYVCVCA
mgnify:CR=1 FL=1